MKILLILLLSFSAFADITVKIEPKSDFTKYPIPQLRQRVWQLEKAVAELQEKIVKMERSKQGSLTCYIKSFGKTHMSTHNSKMAAKAEVLKKCSEATSSVHCSEENIKCEDEK